MVVPAAAKADAVSSADAGVAAALKVRALGLVPANADGPRNFLACGQPFAVGLAIDLDSMAPQGAVFEYRASVYAKQLQGRARQALGEARGTLAPGSTATARVHASELPRGIYRLEAMVVVVLPADDTRPDQELAAFHEGGLFQVY
jgi:hypothetical protein